MEAALPRESLAYADPAVVAADHAEAAVLIPCIEIEKLTVKCVDECHRLFPQAEIIVLPETAANAAVLAGQARIIPTVVVE